MAQGLAAEGLLAGRIDLNSVIPRERRPGAGINPQRARDRGNEDEKTATAEY